MMSALLAHRFARTRHGGMGGAGPCCAAALAAALASCHSEVKSGEIGTLDGATADAGGFSQAHFCDLPGSVKYTSSGAVTVPPGTARPSSLAFLKLPPGFCAHEFATVGNTRQLRFA